MIAAEFWLSRLQRDIMIEHLDGVAIPIIRPLSCIDGLDRQNAQRRLQTTTSLLIRRYLKPDNKIKPTHTLITDRGREVLAALLGDWADALARAEWDTAAIRTMYAKATGMPLSIAESQTAAGQ